MQKYFKGGPLGNWFPAGTNHFHQERPEAAQHTVARHTQVPHFAPLSIASDCAMQGRAESRPEVAQHTATRHTQVQHFAPLSIASDCAMQG